MYARVSTAELQPGRMDEVIDISRDSVLPAAQQQRGFRSGLWLTDRDANKIMIVSLWETKEDMEAGERSGYYREQIGKFAGMLAGDVVREAYEVSIQA
jgi:heme-degrading monooxygenase HmoA